MFHGIKKRFSCLTGRDEDGDKNAPDSVPSIQSFFKRDTTRVKNVISKESTFFYDHALSQVTDL